MAVLLPMPFGGLVCGRWGSAPQAIAYGHITERNPDRHRAVRRRRPEVHGMVNRRSETARRRLRSLRLAAVAT